jgi:hypothetical protein
VAHQGIEVLLVDGAGSSSELLLWIKGQCDVS